MRFTNFDIFAKGIDMPIIQIHVEPNDIEDLKNLCIYLEDSGIYNTSRKIITKMINVMHQNENDSRNAEILRMRQSGSTYRELASIFNLTYERIRQICIKEIRKQITKSELEKEDYSDFYTCLCKACKLLGYDSKLVWRSYNCLARGGIIDEMENDSNITLDNWTDETLMKIRNFGIRSLEVARAANNIYKNYKQEG